MSDYDKVQKALASGADPAMLCTTCPWYRYCVLPPSMTAAAVESKVEEARRKDEDEDAKARAMGKGGGMPMTSLLTLVTVGAADKQAMVCPVFAVRLRSGAGRSIVDGLKAHMKAWDDGAVDA